MNNIDIGNRLKELRKQKKYTQKQVSSQAGVSRSYYADLENGRYSPSIETLRKLANSLNTSTSYLIDGNKNILDISMEDFQSTLKELAKQPASLDSDHSSFSETLKELNEIPVTYENKQINKKISYPNASIPQINFLISCDELLDTTNIDPNSQIYTYLSNVNNILSSKNFSTNKEQDMSFLKELFNQILEDLN